MKLKSLAIVTLLVLGSSFAFARSYTFGFENYNGSALYCNYEQFVTVNGDYLAYGYDNLTTACGGTVNATILGVQTTVPPTAGLGQSGAAYGMADNLYDALYGVDTNFQWFVVTKTQGNKIKQGWFGLAGYNGYILGGNAGLITKTIPTGATPTIGVSIGNNKLAKVKK